MTIARRLSSLLLLTTALGLVGLGHARADELVAGGYEAGADAAMPATDLELSESFEASGSGAPASEMAFTPRASGSLFALDDGDAADADFHLTVKGHESWMDGSRLGKLGLIEGDVGTESDLMIGGGLGYDAFEIIGGLGRATMMGTDADLLAAGVAYGPLSARLVVAQTVEPEDPRDVVMFSTDLAAWSWLTLQGDVAFSETLEREPLTVGRVGFRLNF